MKRQFSLAHLTVLGLTPPEMTYVAAKAGYDFVSFRPISLGTVNEPEYPLAEDKALLRETKNALAETGLKVLDIEMVRIYDGLDPKVYLPAFEVGAELGARHVLTASVTTDTNFMIECFAELCELAEPYGLTMDLEFLTWYNVSTLQEAIEVMQKVNKDNSGILVDTLHFHRSRVSINELETVPQKWFHYVHICDAPKDIPTTTEGLIHTAREERLYLGEGGIDVASILNRMPNIPYSIEIPHAKRSKELGYEEFARQCLQTTKKYFENHICND